MATWIFDGRELCDADLAGAYGFIYLITHLPTGKKYLGRKYLTKAATKQVKGVKKKIRKESDWRDYYSSSPELLEMLAQEGPEVFSREVLVLCKTRGETNYMEVLLQYLFGVLHDPNYINSNISSKYFKKNVLKYVKLPVSLRSLLPTQHPAFH